MGSGYGPYRSRLGDVQVILEDDLWSDAACSKHDEAKQVRFLPSLTRIALGEARLNSP
jgi:hypothetical protein